MGNVGKRSGMHKHRRAFQSLHQVRLDRVFHQHGQGSRHAQILGGHCLALLAQTNHNLTDPPAHIGQVGGQGQDRHELTRHGDVETCFALKPGFFRALAHRHPAQEAVAGVQHPPPGNRLRVDVQTTQSGPLFRGQLIRVALLNSQLCQPAQQSRTKSTFALPVCRAQAIEHLLIRRPRLVQDSRIDRRRQQVVGRCNRMNVTRQVQVEVLHRDHLAVATAGCAAFNAKGRSLAGLANAGHNPVAQMRTQCLAQPHCSGGFTLAQRCRGDGGHVDVMPVRRILQPLQH